ncbi:hypothetical protein BCR43DRAFT_497962 [Syncephalastrum racemosum]|uniref:Uncharacterized protein n=1 Tax=Syncephalastrum racemosum TaxID=13706 RepID=A0A1X2H3A8_SYNRA|nr:hypothetical protein BCR43DRAFT_497962 [Syncephalastrum racemosum]
MSGTTATSTPVLPVHNNRVVKWTAQYTTFAPPSGMQKRKTLSGRVQKKSNPRKANGSPQPSPMRRLESELGSSNDSLATITIMFDSLRHAFNAGRPAMERSSTATRLGDMEKELLTAYDDLGLQVRHLDRRMQKLQKEIQRVKEEHQPQRQQSTPQLQQDDYSPVSTFAEDEETTPSLSYCPTPSYQPESPSSLSFSSTSTYPAFYHTVPMAPPMMPPSIATFAHDMPQQLMTPYNCDCLSCASSCAVYPCL